MPLARRYFALLALISLSACASDLTAPSDVDLAAAVTGEWAGDQSIPGSFLDFTLQASDTSVTGSGSFAGEAGPGGTIAIVGGASRSTLTLHFTYTRTYPDVGTYTARFVGTLDANGLLVGTMKYGPEVGDQPETTVVFRRQFQLYVAEPQRCGMQTLTCRTAAPRGVA